MRWWSYRRPSKIGGYELIRGPAFFEKRLVLQNGACQEFIRGPGQELTRPATPGEKWLGFTGPPINSSPINSSISGILLDFGVAQKWPKPLFLWCSLGGGHIPTESDPQKRGS